MEIKIFAEPTKEQLKPLTELEDKYWGEPIHAGDTDDQFFDLPRLMVCAMEDNKAVSGLEVLLKSVLIEDQFYPVAGIGGVITHIDYRRKKYATKVLERTLDYLRNAGIKIALLNTDLERLGGLYEGVGFEMLDKPYYFLNKDDVEMSENGGMICFLDNSVNRAIWLNKKTKLFVGRSNF